MYRNDHLTDTAIIRAYHLEMIRTYGRKSSLALGWRDRESQLVRFRVLAGLADMTGRSVLDIGCGYGDLLPYLTNLYGQISYTGIEQMPELIETAIANYGSLPNVNFISGNFATLELPVTDIILASGSLNYRNADPEFIYNIIKQLFGACRIGLGFNLLRDIIPNGMLVAYDPEKIFDYCHSISPNTKLTDGYAPEDFTIYMYK